MPRTNPRSRPRTIDAAGICLTRDDLPDTARREASPLLNPLQGLAD